MFHFPHCVGLQQTDDCGSANSFIKYYCPRAIRLKWFALGFYKKAEITGDISSRSPPVEKQFMRKMGVQVFAQ